MIAKSEARQDFVHRHLSPADRLAEVMCGLIMVLTFTLTAGLTAGDGPDAVRSLLLAAIGCNIAWGIIDGVLYIMSSLSQRAEKARVVRAVQGLPEGGASLDLVREAVGPKLFALASSDDKAAQDAVFVATQKYLVNAVATPARVTGDDVRGAIAIFWLELLACLPAALPFMFIKQPVLALHVSNAILVGMLFLTGQKWAQYVGAPRLLSGLAMSAIGLALVGVAALLGG
jgi:hypothetical protein